MQDVLIDSDVVIEWLRGNQKIVDRLLELKRSGKLIFYSPVTKAEIFHGLRPDEEKITADFFQACSPIPIDDEIGEKAGRYLAQYHKSHSLALGDALIAATCCQHKLTLFSLNRKHYPMSDIRKLL
ncbi:MAG: type II toxin-antitoxin system VapC family toxin [bacterium]|jgi:predicted nucleic acid-binding protein|nr:type II toxin-antitoxin system VapC family toxin [bacterium]MDD3805285.1 type II toxin-antitoxin system VapC family toxin [bacterium]MDD4558471.1 type II toxin-antitoxin system VapC family toxin [bacterium]